jgi:hypothetical protein
MMMPARITPMISMLDPYPPGAKAIRAERTQGDRNVRTRSS